jgi:hypothetical protein
MRPLHLVRAVAVLTGLCAGTCPGAPGGEFAISLKVQAGGREQTVASGKPGTTPPAFAARAREVLAVQWAAVNGAPGVSLSDVTLHVFLDPVSASANGPRPGPKALYESAAIADFEHGAKSSGDFRMPVLEPGKYLLRVETIGAARKLGREIAAEMQVSVQ